MDRDPTWIALELTPSWLNNPNSWGGATLLKLLFLAGQSSLGLPLARAAMTSCRKKRIPEVTALVFRGLTARLLRYLARRRWNKGSAGGATEPDVEGRRTEPVSMGLTALAAASVTAEVSMWGETLAWMVEVADMIARLWGYVFDLRLEMVYNRWRCRKEAWQSRGLGRERGMIDLDDVKPGPSSLPR
jgi:hypothetical protein